MICEALWCNMTQVDSVVRRYRPITIGVYLRMPTCFTFFFVFTHTLHMIYVFMESNRRMYVCAISKLCMRVSFFFKFIANDKMLSGPSCHLYIYIYSPDRFNYFRIHGHNLKAATSSQWMLESLILFSLSNIATQRLTKIEQTKKNIYSMVFWMRRCVHHSQ